MYITVFTVWVAIMHQIILWPVATIQTSRDKVPRMPAQVFEIDLNIRQVLQRSALYIKFICENILFSSFRCLTCYIVFLSAMARILARGVNSMLQ